MSLENNNFIKQFTDVLRTGVSVFCVVYFSKRYFDYRETIIFHTDHDTRKFYEDNLPNEISINTEDHLIKYKSFLIYLIDSDFITYDPTNNINRITYMEFIKEYEKLDMDADIIINIKTTGGSSYYATLICQLINKHRGKVTARISEYASSAGTFIALSCDEIQMTSTAALGMIDPQFMHGDIYYSAKEVLTTKESSKDKFDDNLIRVSAANIENTCKNETIQFLKKNYNESDIKKIMEIFYDAEDCHSKHLFYDDIKDILGDKLVLYSPP